MVGVGDHHHSVQWPHTPMDERQRGNPAAVACQVGLGLLGFRALLSPTPRSVIFLVVKAVGNIMHENSSFVIRSAPLTVYVLKIYVYMYMGIYAYRRHTHLTWARPGPDPCKMVTHARDSGDSSFYVKCYQVPK